MGGKAGEKCRPGTVNKTLNRRSSCCRAALPILTLPHTFPTSQVHMFETTADGLISGHVFLSRDSTTLPHTCTTLSPHLRCMCSKPPSAFWAA